MLQSLGIIPVFFFLVVLFGTQDYRGPYSNLEKWILCCTIWWPGALWRTWGSSYMSGVYLSCIFCKYILVVKLACNVQEQRLSVTCKIIHWLLLAFHNIYSSFFHLSRENQQGPPFYSQKTKRVKYCHHFSGDSNARVQQDDYEHYTLIIAISSSPATSIPSTITPFKTVPFDSSCLIGQIICNGYCSFCNVLIPAMLGISIYTCILTFRWIAEKYRDQQ